MAGANSPEEQRRIDDSMLKRAIKVRDSVKRTDLLVRRREIENRTNRKKKRLFSERQDKDKMRHRRLSEDEEDWN